MNFPRIFVLWITYIKIITNNNFYCNSFFKFLIIFKLLYPLLYDILFITFRRFILKKDFNIKLQNFFSKAIIFLVGIITFVIGFFSIGKTAFFNVVINFASEISYIKSDNILLNLLFLVLTLLLLYFLYKKILPKINKKILFIFMVVFSLIFGFWWINYIKLVPISDQFMVYYCSQQLIKNDLKPILNSGNYLSRNPHQLGFVLFLTAIAKIFNNNGTIIIQFTNVVFATICAITLYFIVKELFKEDLVQKIALLLITFFSIYFAFFCPHIYGNISGLAFGLISLLFTLKFIDSNRVLHLIITALSITFSYLLKSNYEIFLVAIIITLVLKAIQDFKIKSIVGILGIIITVFGIKTAIYTCTEKITGYSLNNGVPVISYIYMGIAEPATLTPGWYTGDVENIYNEANFSKEKSEEITKDLLSNRLNYLSKNLGYTYGYFKSKLETTWLNPTFQTIWCSTPGLVLDQNPGYNNYICAHKFLISILCGKAFNLEERIMDIYQILIFLTASFSLFVTFKEISLKKTLLPLIFLGGFLFHLIWETKSIYVLQYFYLLVPYSAYGIYKLFSFLDTKLKKIKENPPS